MFPLPAILTFGYPWVYVHLSNCSNVPSNIKASIDKVLSLAPTLNIPNVYPDNGHIRLGRNLDDSWFGSKNNIVKNLILLYDVFDIARRETNLRIIVGVIWDAYDFQIGLGLWEMWNLNTRGINTVNILNIFLNDDKIGQGHNLVCDNCNVGLVWSDEIDQDLSFGILQCPILMFATCDELSFMNLAMLSPFIGIMTCFLDGPLVVIWIRGLGLGLPLTMFWIFFAPREGKVFLILMICSVFEAVVDACA